MHACEESLIKLLELSSSWELKINWVSYFLKLLLIRLCTLFSIGLDWYGPLVWFLFREGFSFHGFLKCKKLIR